MAGKAAWSKKALKAALWWLRLLVRAEGERGQWVVYYNSLQSFIMAFSYSLSQQLWGLSHEL